MKRVILFLLVIAILKSACGELVESAQAKYSGGSGTADDPYKIANVADLLTLAADTNDYNQCFILTADVNMEGQVFTTAIIAPDTVAGNYSFDGTAFTGIFNGNGHKVTNFTINGGINWYLGLFGYIGSGGSVKNLGLENFTVSGYGTGAVGGLAGVNYGSSISNCYSTGTVTGGDGANCLGGLVGVNYGSSISNCYSTGAVTGGDNSYYLGGLVGYSCNYISHCYSTGTVSGGGEVGGLVGGIGYGTIISNCYSTGSVSGSYEVGGLVGWNGYGSISNCYSTGLISGSSYVGGLVGYNSDSSISNCYSTGTVSGSSNSHCIGGLVGCNSDSSISNCYSTGTVSGSRYVGGLVGYNNGGSGSVSSSYFLITSGPDDGNGTPLTDAQMKQKSSFVGWDFSFIWDIVEGQTYPFFKSGGGPGTPDDPYQIATKVDLLAMAADTNNYDKCFILTADIDMEGQVFTTAIIAAGGGTAFTGIFDGNDHKITNFTINGGSNSYLGLFGRIGSGGSIKNLGLENFTVSGDSGSWNVGGLVGYNYYGSISNCYSTGNVTGGYEYVGGLVGWNGYGSISNCYSTGMVNGSSYVGGLVGYNDGGSVLGSFWDTESSGQTTSDGGTGKTTVEMKTKSTFTDAGWDFSFIWDIVEGQTYPFFKSGFGTGTPDDPYRIATKVDLLAMAADTSYYDKCFILTADIDMEGQVFTTAIIAADTVAGNYSFDGTAFTGIFNGNGHKVTNFTINGGSNNYLGLFGRIGYGGSVKNLGLENFTVSGDSNSWCVGGLVGINYGNINNCYSTGAVTGFQYVGGLAGYNCGTISNCNSTGAVSGSDLVGGLVGDNYGSISNCYSTGAVTGRDNSQYLGGLVGDNCGSISDCYSTGAVSGGTCVGGLVGQNGYGSISNCYSTGAVTVTGGYRANGLGGLAGANYSNISNCYSTGTVTGGDYSNYLGGLVGGNGYGSISNCYSTGAVTGGDNSYGLGGLVGESGLGGATISNCYSTGAVTGGDDSYCLGGLVGYNVIGSISNCFSTGNVTAGIYSGYLGGLVGYNNDGIGISNCYSTGAVTGGDNSYFLGGLVGWSGTISNCYSTGAVTGGYSAWLGGLVGGNYGSISNCFSTGNVTGDYSSCVGGLVGDNYGSISNCYSTGNVTVDYSNAGGLVGDNYYGSISSSYFLITSGPNNGFGTPLTDEQMKQKSSFVDWDFAPIGPDDIWTIKETVDYPKLVWPMVNLVSSRLPLGWYEVDFADLAAMANWWGRTDCASNNDCGGADFDFSGTVDIDDLSVMCNYWL